MGEQLHKKFDDTFVKSVFKKYLSRDLSVKQVCDILQLKKSRFFVLINKYKLNPDEFSVLYKRSSPKRISTELEQIILSELEQEKKLINNSEIPITTYNYTYIRDQIYKYHRLKVSVPTIIKRAKQHNYYIPKKPRKVHDREVITNYPGEMIQHDSSFHRFSPYVENKWYLVTSLDDFSRYMLYAKLLEKETSWAHIKALENVMLNVGIPR
jgi:transposase